MFTAVVSKFVYPRLYKKGSLIETVGIARDAVRVVLRGQIAVFEPINYKSFKNCEKNIKEGLIDLEWLNKIVHKNQSPNTDAVHFSV